MGGKKQKINIPMCAAFILFVLTLISMHMTSGLFARYTVTSTGSDSARVAKFEVLAAGGNDVTMDCTMGKEPGEYTITVENNSEVAVKYSATVVFDQDIPGTALSVTMDGKYGTSVNNKSLKFSDMGSLGPNSEPKTHTLRFVVDNWSHVTSDAIVGVEGKETAKWDLSFTVTVHAEQID